MLPDFWIRFRDTARPLGLPVQIGLGFADHQSPCTDFLFTEHRQQMGNRVAIGPVEPFGNEQLLCIP